MWVTQTHSSYASSPQGQRAMRLANEAAHHLAWERTSVHILLRTLQGVDAWEDIIVCPAEQLLHFKGELVAGRAELAYLLRLPHAFLVRLGRAFAVHLANRIHDDCTEQGVAEETELLCSLQITVHRPQLSEEELESLEAFVKDWPSEVRNNLGGSFEDQCRMAPTCSVLSSTGLRTTLYWEAEEGHTFFGSNLLDGGDI